jgi:dTDP-glucose pyrophosphorylase
MQGEGSRATRAVILARGLGKRMRAADPGAVLTEPQRRAADAGLKAMIPIGARPFLDYLLSAVADAGLRDVALVVAPDHDAVRRHYEADAPPSRVRISFLIQPEALGTANAVLAAEAWTDDEPFVVMNADNLYPVAVLRALAALDEPGLPAFRRDELVRTGNIREDQVQSFALVEVGADGHVTRIVEKPDPDMIAAAGPSAMVSMNCWRFDRRIFAACRDVPRSARGEFELPQAVMLAVTRGVRFRAVPASGPVLDLSRRSDATEVARRLADAIPQP